MIGPSGELVKIISVAIVVDEVFSIQEKKRMLQTFLLIDDEGQSTSWRESRNSNVGNEGGWDGKCESSLTSFMMQDVKRNTINGLVCILYLRFRNILVFNWLLLEINNK